MGMKTNFHCMGMKTNFHCMGMKTNFHCMGMKTNFHCMGMKINNFQCMRMIEGHGIFSVRLCAVGFILSSGYKSVSIVSQVHASMGADIHVHTYIMYIYSAVCMHAGTDSDLEYFVRACGDIVGVTSKLTQDGRTGKHVLEYIFAQLVEFKKSSQVPHGVLWMMNIT